MRELLKTVGSLFEEEPKQWGLRGDPFMWRELKEIFSQVPLPASGRECERLIRQALYDIINAEAANPLPDRRDPTHARYRIERFSHGSMSSGYVSTQFWETTGIPILVQRYNRGSASREIKSTCHPDSFEEA